MQTYLHGAQKLAMSHWNRRRSANNTEERQHEVDVNIATDAASLIRHSSSPTHRLSPLPPPADAVFTKDAVPQFGVVNDFIHAGYRPQLDYRKCIMSAFAWNNETLNIWTHVIAVLVFIVQMLRFNWVILPSMENIDSILATTTTTSTTLSSTSSTSSPTSSSSSSSSSSSDETSSLFTSFPSLSSSLWSSSSWTYSGFPWTVGLVWNMSLICFALCMAFSAGFHLFSCHSLEVSTRWLGLDFVGMSVATLGCYLSGIFCAFACRPFWRDFYLTVVVGILLLILFLPAFLRDYWAPDWVWVRAAIQIGAVSFGVIPILHAIIVEGGFFASFPRLFLVCVFDLYFYAALSFFFYASKLPERFLPGTFDFLGQSHQIWHICIFYTLYNWHHRTLQMLQFRYKNAC